MTAPRTMTARNGRTLSEGERLIGSLAMANYREGVQEASEGETPELDRLRTLSSEARDKLRTFIADVMQ